MSRLTYRFVFELQRSKHIVGSGLGGGLRRREQEMGAVGQLVRSLQGPTVPSPGEQHVSRGWPQAPGPRDRDELRDSPWPQVQPGDRNLSPVARQ